VPDSKHILLIAATTGYQTRAFAEAGARLGYDVQLATDRCHILDDPWGDQAVPLRFENPASVVAALAESARMTRFDGVVAVGDRPAYLASLVAAELGLRYSAPEAVARCRNKYLAHGWFSDAGLNVAAFRRIPIDEDPAVTAMSVSYPCVLKPLGLSASRGVIRADDRAQFVAAFRRIRDILASPDIVRMHDDQDRFLQVEDYIEGEEYALEGLVTGGRLQVIAIFDKPDPLTGPFFEETIYVTPSRAPATVQEAIVETTRAAVRALGLTHGPVHAEMRVNARGVWMLEVAARPIGGLCAQALRFENRWTLEEVVLRHAAGESLESVRLDAPARGVMMIPIPRAGVYQGVDGVVAARAAPGIEDVIITAKEGQKLVPLPEGASYLGFIFAAGRAPAQVEQSMREAHRRLRFGILDALPVL
jgi:biotin carboxylase